MNTNFINDTEIDKVLGRIREFKDGVDLSKPVDRFNISPEDKALLRSEYARKKTQQYMMDPAATKVEQRPYYDSVKNMQVITDSFTSASIVRRTYAFCTDLCIVGVALAGFVLTTTYFTGTNSFMNAGTTWITSLYCAIFVFYLVYFEGLLGQTPGKMFLNIKVMDQKNEKPSFLRSMARMVLFFILPIGLLGLHNLITKTRLVNLD